MRKNRTGNGNPPPVDSPIKKPQRQAPAEPLDPSDDGEQTEDTGGKK